MKHLNSGTWDWIWFHLRFPGIEGWVTPKLCPGVFSNPGLFPSVARAQSLTLPIYFSMKKTQQPQNSAFPASLLSSAMVGTSHGMGVTPGGEEFWEIGSCFPKIQQLRRLLGKQK